MMHAFIVKMPA